jgi:hypothetical protein
MFRIRADRLNAPVNDLLQEPARAADRAPGAHTGDEMRYPPLGLGQDLGAGSRAVRVGIGSIVVLVGQPAVSSAIRLATWATCAGSCRGTAPVVITTSAPYALRMVTFSRLLLSGTTTVKR